MTWLPTEASLPCRALLSFKLLLRQKAWGLAQKLAVLDIYDAALLRVEKAGYFHCDTGV